MRKTHVHVQQPATHTWTAAIRFYETYAALHIYELCEPDSAVAEPQDDLFANAPCARLLLIRGCDQGMCCAEHRLTVSSAEHLRGSLLESGALLLGQRTAVLAALLGRRCGPRRPLCLLLPVCILQVALQRSTPLSGGRVVAMHSLTHNSEARYVSATWSWTAACPT